MNQILFVDSILDLFSGSQHLAFSFRVCGRIGLINGMPSDMPLNIKRTAMQATPIGINFVIFLLISIEITLFKMNTAAIIGNVSHSECKHKEN